MVLCLLCLGRVVQSSLLCSLLFFQGFRLGCLPLSMCCSQVPCILSFFSWLPILCLGLLWLSRLVFESLFYQCGFSLLYFWTEFHLAGHICFWLLFCLLLFLFCLLSGIPFVAFHYFPCFFYLLIGYSSGCVWSYFLIPIFFFSIFFISFSASW